VGPGTSQNKELSNIITSVNLNNTSILSDEVNLKNLDQSMLGEQAQQQNQSQIIFREDMMETRMGSSFIRQSNLNSKERFKIFLNELKVRRNPKKASSKSHIPSLIKALRLSLNQIGD
jgi:hypothetical protein